MDKRYCIFDMDGTLVDSMRYWKNLQREFLADKGLPISLEEALAATQHLTVPEASALFIERFNMEGTVESITEEFNNIMAGHYRNHIEVKPGAEAYLNALHQQGVKMYVGSATSAPLVRISMEHTGLEKYFDGIISCVDIGVSKNRPDIFLEAARRMGCTNPADAAVFEDSALAATVAKEAGFYVVGILDPESPQNWETLRNVADEIVEDWRTFGK